METTEADEVALLLRAKKDLEWLSEHKSKLMEDYNNKFIAVKDSKILGSNNSLDVLVANLEKKGINVGGVLIKYITNTALVL